MSKRALIAEAKSIHHQTCHFPHNPFCEICIEANMRQMRFARASLRTDDGLKPFYGFLEVLSADSILVSIKGDDVKRISASSNSVIHTVRDAFSGMALALQSNTKTSDVFYRFFKHFGGRLGSTNPNILVKSDVAGEIIKAVESLGWLSETSLANRWPHNAVHERWHGTFKSVLRAAIRQSGFPVEA